ncbi:MAG: glycoside hydrolase family 130 protein [Chthoniobacterales bacterium]|nr:glycoside hydrolase family 130 protein [Chthoniobacterales bacterium]
MSAVTLHPTNVSLFPDSRRVLLRSFIPGDTNRIIHTITRALALSEAEVESELSLLMDGFAKRHLDLHQLWQQNFEKVKSYLFISKALSAPRQLYIGALFSGEYSLESAALFNPSIVLHPDQSNIPEGSLRFILSLRATGEGHVSSIEFRSGVINETFAITMEEPSSYVITPKINTNTSYVKSIFEHKVMEMGFENEWSALIMASLDSDFSLIQLEKAVEGVSFGKKPLVQELRRTIECVRWLAESNYEVCFDPSTHLAERAIFPISSNESNGMEDARFVRFIKDDGTPIYYGTYTAYNGRSILPQLLETKDFLCFRSITLNGSAVQNKGLALFPRMLDGRYAMVSRQDGENLYLMYSDNLHFWHDAKLLRCPGSPWEGVNIGNCGSPIETEKGWLLITHGVGPMRKYCMGAMLLDLNDPSIVLSALKNPLITPQENEREGYVPNVVYSCGAMLHRDRLILPYGISDTATTIVTVELKELFEGLERDKTT